MSDDLEKLNHPEQDKVKCLRQSPQNIPHKMPSQSFRADTKREKNSGAENHNTSTILERGTSKDNQGPTSLTSSPEPAEQPTSSIISSLNFYNALMSKTTKDDNPLEANMNRKPQRLVN